ncbi:MAG: lanthionine synthetase LanC family protein [Bacteroidota bacterium]
MGNQQFNRFTSRIDFVNKIFAKNEKNIQANGLFHGRMGHALFYYHLYKFTGAPSYEEKADELTDKVYTGLHTNNASPDFEGGLAGIGWGIEYLVQNGFVEANTDEILEEVDSRIFQHVIHTEKVPINFNNGLLGYATYIIWRLKNCHNPELYKIQEGLLIEIVNKITVLLDKQLVNYSEPAGFNLFWDLPVILLVFGEILELGIYRNKIYQVLKELTPVVCTLIPLLHCNRVFLLRGIYKITKNYQLAHWEKHANILASNILFQTILYEEFTDRSIFLHNGLAGVYTMVHSILRQSKLNGQEFIPDLWWEKILNSSVWDLLEQKEKQLPASLGLIGGLPGTLLVLLTNQYKNVSPLCV